MSDDDELLEGYLDGFNDDRDELPCLSNRSQFYIHGWLNGRDDRKGNPRAAAAKIRADYTALYDGGGDGRD